ncbi:hypothetical protein EJB05_07788 [Eragrostis curvula]|uniref:Uncharacterized protein n=1 Tax=Eragrostis curvula TaxID=38414 RepID=A0A5J9WHH8_9POAL|nr:hypothetical protein EJB05_07788 [Eragrostis curvula]
MEKITTLYAIHQLELDTEHVLLDGIKVATIGDQRGKLSFQVEKLRVESQSLVSSECGKMHGSAARDGGSA